MSALCALVALALAAVASAQPFQPGTGFLPLGNLRTSDYDGPYNLSLLPVQANEIKGGIAAKHNYTDKDIIDFLVNVECLEGLFDTWGAFGRGFLGDLEKGGPTPIGAKKANITSTYLGFLQEVALNEQGHALFTRHGGSSNPCPLIDFTGGWNKWLAAAYELPTNVTIEQQFGAAFDPFQDTQTFVTCVAILEELGATGNKGLIGLTTNPVLANGISGLATSATAQAAVERFIMWELRNETIFPFNETVQQVFARASALRDKLDGAQIDDQGLTNTDPRYLAVPDNYCNLIPTDVQGLTFSRTPQMLINILTLGNPNGTGVFFPNGLLGRINKPTGYNVSDSGMDSFCHKPYVATQESMEQVGNISAPINGSTPSTVPDMYALTQCVNGTRENTTAASRNGGYIMENACTPNNSTATNVTVAMPMGSLPPKPKKGMRGICKGGKLKGYA